MLRPNASTCPPGLLAALALLSVTSLASAQPLPAVPVSAELNEQYILELGLDHDESHDLRQWHRRYMTDFREIDDTKDHVANWILFQNTLVCSPTGDSSSVVFWSTAERDATHLAARRFQRELDAEYFQRLREVTPEHAEMIDDWERGHRRRQWLVPPQGRTTSAIRFGLGLDLPFLIEELNIELDEQAQQALHRHERALDPLLVEYEERVRFTEYVWGAIQQEQTIVGLNTAGLTEQQRRRYVDNYLRTRLDKIAVMRRLRTELLEGLDVMCGLIGGNDAIRLRHHAMRRILPGFVEADPRNDPEQVYRELMRSVGDELPDEPRERLRRMRDEFRLLSVEHAERLNSLFIGMTSEASYREYLADRYEVYAGLRPPPETEPYFDPSGFYVGEVVRYAPLSGRAEYDSARDRWHDIARDYAQSMREIVRPYEQEQGNDGSEERSQ